VFDPDREWIYQRKDSASKSRNSPFDGWRMKGRAVMTIVRGKIVWREETALATVQLTSANR
jgi:dihydroorotase